MKLTNKIKDFIKGHSLESSPNECGGLVLEKDDGVIDLCKCTNVSEHPKESCLIKKKEIEEKSGNHKIICLYHSHALGPQELTWEDKATSENFGLDLILYCVESDKFITYEPNGYIAPFTGRHWVQGIFTCIDMVIDYYRKNFNISINGYEDLTLYNRQLKYFDFSWAYLLTSSVGEPKNDGRKMMDEIAITPDHEQPWQLLLRSNDFTQVKDLKKHDVILTKAPSEKFNKKYNINYPVHAAVYLGDGMVLHHPYWRKSLIDRLDKEVGPFMTHIFRHKNLHEN